ncbi:cytosine deaminase [Skermanella stibiiresistens SB22]|uniref:Cytosine deaminase n=1 Tax=Skermanella stibiiresistens SB22 TaxID=1385369 RepID=W9H8S1_9PROT|nr:cytosine deaminase [Skermanella stibiiresistens]EWY41116.1 cytosine deaminase [Skermanella stibiiresistens SB22]
MPIPFQKCFAGPSPGAKFWLKKATVPLSLLADPLPGIAAGAGRDDLVPVDIRIENGAVAAVLPEGTAPCCGPGFNLEHGIVWPCPVDIHTHLDKGHIWPRQENPDGTFKGALDAVARDREAHWSARDVAARMEFGLKCGHAHGTAAIRTHLDSQGPQADISWPVFAEARDRWAGRITLQAVSLVMIETYLTDEGVRIADLVARHGGVLGCVSYMIPGIDTALDRLFALAAERGLDVDFHVDETDDPSAESLRHIAQAVLRAEFQGRVLCGHCCSLATQDPDQALATLDLVAEAGLAVVTLPMCNLYLQDRVPGRTPRWRGVTLLHEMRARGIPVAVASDNCRDPFYGYGDHDMVEVHREATRILHLDRPFGDWPRATAATPAHIMRLDDMGLIGDGRAADLIVFRARTYSELLSRPQSDRTVLRAGTPLDVRPPDYRELDELFT